MRQPATLIAWARGKAARSLIVITVVVIAVFAATRIGLWTSCKIYGYQTERETRYAAFVGCMVKLDGKWYPRNELRIVQ